MEQWQSRERYKEGLRTFRADTSHLLICLKLESIATSCFFAGWHTAQSQDSPESHHKADGKSRHKADAYLALREICGPGILDGDGTYCEVTAYEEFFHSETQQEIFQAIDHIIETMFRAGWAAYQNRPQNQQNQK